jgi:hypothetical protein
MVGCGREGEVEVDVVVGAEVDQEGKTESRPRGAFGKQWVVATGFWGSFKMRIHRPQWPVEIPDGEKGRRPAVLSRDVLSVSPRLCSTLLSEQMDDACLRKGGIKSFGRLEMRPVTMEGP